MEEVKCEQVATLRGGKWEKTYEESRRVYGIDGISPTVHTQRGGYQEVKIMLDHQCVIDPCAYDEQNGYLRNDGTVGSLTTVGSSPKHNNRIVEPKLVGGFGCMKSNGGTQYYQQDRVYDGDEIAMCYPASISGGSYNYKVQDCRVRKLTERECFRLQGVKDEDFERVRANQSKSSCYHLAGDSITVSVLMALFGEMLDIDWRSSVEELVDTLCSYDK